MSMPSTSGRHAAFSSSSPESNYRPISQLAVVSMTLAVASMLAFVTIYAWFLPVIAIVVSIGSYRKLNAARREYAGQRAAQFAILLTLVSLIGAPTRYFTERFLLIREARTASDQYLDQILSNRLDESFVGTLPPINRTGMEDAPKALIDRLGIERYQMHLGGSVVQMLAGKGADAQVTFIGAQKYDVWQGQPFVTFRYNILLGDGQTIDVQVVAQGTLAPTDEWIGRAWQIIKSDAAPIVTATAP